MDASFVAGAIPCRYLSTYPLPKRGGVMIYEEGECETLGLLVAH